MTRAEFKKMLKPIIKECISESLLEEGILSSIIAEVMRGINSQQMIVEESQNDSYEAVEEDYAEEQERVYAEKLNETKKKMLNAIGKNSYNGVNLFENTEPMSSAPSPGESVTPNSPLAGVAANDSGVNIDGLLGSVGKRWNAMTKGNK
jgi:hypothetical protein